MEEQRFNLIRTTQGRIAAHAERFALNYGWMRYFFFKNCSPDKLSTIELQRRAVWIAFALLCQSLEMVASTLRIGSNLEDHWFVLPLKLCGALLPPGLTLGGFFALWIAMKPATQDEQLAFLRQHGGRGQRIALLRTCIMAVIGCFMVISGLIQCFLPPAYTNDGTSLDANAARLLLAGHNPYSTSSILDIARYFPIQPEWTTPLRVGQFTGRLDYPSIVDFRSTFVTALKAGKAPEFESRVSYPALAFLTLLPFTLANLPNVLPFYLASYLLLVWIGWKATRKELKPWLLLLALANIPMLSAATTGSLDIFALLLVVLAWLFREQRWLSVVFLGLALASKQTTWFFAPFYLVMLWRQSSPKEGILRLSLAGSIALVINLPFIIWNAKAWLAGILAPITDPMFPLGTGLINLSSYHLLPYLPPGVYLTLELIAMAGALVHYWRICHACPEAAILLAVLPLFLAWRSLPSYFSCTAFPLFVLMMARNNNRNVRINAQPGPGK